MGVKQDLDFIRVNLWIAWRRLLEYKVNFYSAICVQIVWVSIYFTFFKVIANELGSVIGWGLKEFFLFWIIVNLNGCIIGFLTWKVRLFKLITNGTLNNYLMRPKNTLLFCFFHNFDSPTIVFIFSDIIIFFIFIFCYNLHLVNLFSSFCLFVLMFLSYFFMVHFFEALNFFIYNAKTFTNPFYKVTNILEDYPAQFFDNSYFRKVLYFFPSFYVGFLIVPRLLGQEILGFEIQLILLCLLLVFFMFFTILLWHYGLKRYEAFG